MSNDWTIKKSRSQIASSNSAMSSVFIAIERAREVEAALAQSCKTDGKQRLPANHSTGSEFDISSVLANAVREQVEAYRAVVQSVGDSLVLIGGLMRKRMVEAGTVDAMNQRVVVTPRIPGSNLNPGISTSCPKRIPNYSQRPDSPRQNEDVPITSKGGSIGSVYLKAPSLGTNL
eukprot:GHVH01011297.1.p1 GENE.GHVH01011297.1~~GHVH01011297.1.p1  ORF type:complete len:175 (-),score=15.32 GHVH01011297.1:169-693(-)